ncbi:hypothetical protein [Streptomyces mirabilis]|uniref:hypothetical protein n=1 Tax=Streptomyces mirabilis TaxID=68239 RepID=UPI002E3430A3|nr:hypothetical protein [Streptomyces mirabilis]
MAAYRPACGVGAARATEGQQRQVPQVPAAEGRRGKLSAAQRAVGDQDVRGPGGQRAQQRRSRFALAGDADAGVALEEGGDAAAGERVLTDHVHAHGGRRVRAGGRGPAGRLTGARARAEAWAGAGAGGRCGEHAECGVPLVHQDLARGRPASAGRGMASRPCSDLNPVHGSALFT